MEVMATEKGRRLWRFLGDTFDGKFYFYKNSKNIKVFHKYMEEENERNKKNKYVDIGDDFTEEEAEYDKELKQDIEAAKHPIKLL